MKKTIITTTLLAAAGLANAADNGACMPLPISARMVSQTDDSAEFSTPKGSPVVASTDGVIVGVKKSLLTKTSSVTVRTPDGNYVLYSGLLNVAHNTHVGTNVKVGEGMGESSDAALLGIKFVAPDAKLSVSFCKA